MSHPSFALLHPSARLVACLALAVLFSTPIGLPPLRAHAQPPVEVASGPRRPEPEFALSPPMRRAVRTTRAGASLLGIGAVGLLASGIVWARIGEDCPADDVLCLSQLPRGMGAFSGLVIGAAILTTGIVTLSIGVARRNHLRRVEGVALGVGPSSVDFRLRF